MQKYQKSIFFILIGSNFEWFVGCLIIKAELLFYNMVFQYNLFHLLMKLLHG
jgi:hypothetical protein